ncbi:hypothetical protein ACVWYQ_003666 [Bradyrhizobium sp. USDA 3397]
MNRCHSSSQSPRVTRPRKEKKLHSNPSARTKSSRAVHLKEVENEHAATSSLASGSGYKLGKKMGTI